MKYREMMILMMLMSMFFVGCHSPFGGVDDPGNNPDDTEVVTDDNSAVVKSVADADTIEISATFTGGDVIGAGIWETIGQDGKKFFLRYDKDQAFILRLDGNFPSLEATVDGKNIPGTSVSFHKAYFRIEKNPEGRVTWLSMSDGTAPVTFLYPDPAATAVDLLCDFALRVNADPANNPEDVWFIPFSKGVDNNWRLGIDYLAIEKQVDGKDRPYHCNVRVRKGQEESWPMEGVFAEAAGNSEALELDYGTMYDLDGDGEKDDGYTLDFLIKKNGQGKPEVVHSGESLTGVDIIINPGSEKTVSSGSTSAGIYRVYSQILSEQVESTNFILEQN